MGKKSFGMVGLGVMGQNFALNLERNGAGVAVYDLDREAATAYLEGNASGKNIEAAASLRELAALLERPRRIMLLVPAGKPVDSVIGELVPLLEQGDLIIDGGNSHFPDSQRRAEDLEAKGIHFLGMGVSGGEEGALRGPSLMPGGSQKAYREVEPILQAVSAKADEDGAACVTYIGSGGSGHFVKMVHNGIEYGDMQLIAEAYQLLRAAGLSPSDLEQVFGQWNEGPLSSFLIEITSKIFGKLDQETGKPLLDMILDKAGQKGTGRWTSQAALDLGTAVPTITAAVDSRILSSMKDERVNASRSLKGPSAGMRAPEGLVEGVREALYASKICCYAQGVKLLAAASSQFRYNLDLAAIARIWRAGCIIRARMLNHIGDAFGRDPGLANLMLDEHFATALGQGQPAWRRVVCAALDWGVPVPALSASLAYYDAYRSQRLPANLVQAQRDYFGAHTFERLDKPGSFHADWK